MASKASVVFEALTGVTSTVSDLKAKLVVKDTQIVALTDELIEIKKPPKVTYRGGKTLIKDAVSDTAERITKRTAIAASRNVTSVVAEAIPYLGIAAILGVTAWDLKDSCETMKDFHELDLVFNPDKAFPAEATEVCGLKVPTKEEVWKDVKTKAVEYWELAGTYVPDLPSFEWPSWSDFVFW